MTFRLYVPPFRFAKKGKVSGLTGTWREGDDEMEATNGKERETERERKKKDRTTLEEYKIDRNIKKRKVERWRLLSPGRETRVLRMCSKYRCVQLSSTFVRMHTRVNGNEEDREDVCDRKSDCLREN